MGRNLILLLCGGLIGLQLYKEYADKDLIDYQFFTTNLLQDNKVKKIFIVKEKDGEHFKIYAKIVDNT